jgi:hypothetical protein
MPKILLPRDDLCATALAQIRKQPGCSGLKEIDIQELSGDCLESNWRAVVFDSGNAQVHDADRAVINVQSGLRHRFDLLTDA